MRYPCSGAGPITKHEPVWRAYQLRVETGFGFHKKNPLTNHVILKYIKGNGPGTIFIIGIYNV
jgi:hypothetical protein